MLRIGARLVAETIELLSPAASIATIYIADTSMCIGREAVVQTRTAPSDTVYATLYGACAHSSGEESSAGSGSTGRFSVIRSNHVAGNLISRSQFINQQRRASVH